MHNMIRLKDNNRFKKDNNKLKKEEYQCFRDKVKDGNLWNNTKGN